MAVSQCCCSVTPHWTALWRTKMTMALLQCILLASLAVVTSAAIGLPTQLPGMPTVPAMPTVSSLPEMPNLPLLDDFSNMVDLNGSSFELPQIMYFPDDDGILRPGKIYGNETSIERVILSDVFFQLYTRRGPLYGELIPMGDVDSLRRSHFNASHHTHFVTHGFLQSIRAETVQSIKNTYLGFHDCNVIAVDWSKISHNWLYFIVKMQVPEVSQLVANFASFLVEEGGVDPSKMHLIAHSLGAHVMGIAGKKFVPLTGKKVGRVTGLDPAGPLFSLEDTSDRLAVGDADFVQAIHTCAGIYGFDGAIADADFFPNGGNSVQPGCNIVTGSACSHSRSWVYFAESIASSGFMGVSCDSYKNFLKGNCNEGAKVPMGEPTPTSASGTYYLKTARRSPFALG